MDYLPVFLNLRERRLLVVGAGNVAARKADLLVRAGGALTVVAPGASDAMQALLKRCDGRLIAREFEARDLDGMSLVLAATDDEAVNRAVYAAATERGIPVNVADVPELCSFILPAIVDRSPVVVAVSTGGRSPVLARHVKALLERALPAGLGRFAAILGAVRKTVQQRLDGVTERRRFWDSVIDGPIGRRALAGEAGIEAAIESALSAWETTRGVETGMVALVGAGPGDPELMTLLGQRLLQRADVVLYDRLIPERLLDLCRREAELVYVGKQALSHVVPQEEIGAMLVRYARAGARVVRLKGGDPFIFGRGGEELEALIDAGVDFQVVPGISAANGCAAYAGIPLTHRDHAIGVSFWTGHMKDGVLDLPWTRMATTGHTHVIFMGLKSLPEVARLLMQHGAAPEVPAAMVSAGTTSAQRVVSGTLATLPDLAAAAKLPSPALLIVGDVVGLRERVGWFEPATQLDEFPFPVHSL